MDVEELHKAAKDRYWKDKDLPAARLLLERGIEAAREQDRPSLENPLQFDLSSFCWPGWDEPGITITGDDLSAGERAAAENLRLTQVLGKVGMPLSRAWFMVGAYRLVRKRHKSAITAFMNQSQYAYRAHEKADVLLAAGYISIASHGMGKGAMLEDILERLGGLDDENARSFVDQLKTAARVFAP